MGKQVSKTTKRRAAKPADEPNQAGQATPAPTAGRPAPVDEVRLRAYLRWEAAGKPPGDGVNFWLEAERELLQRNS